MRQTGLPPDGARSILCRAASDEGWRPSPVPGHAIHDLSRYASSSHRFALIRLDPGAVFPDHRHPVDELAFCICGCGILSRGHVLRPGDFAATPAGDVHACHSVGDVPCVMLLCYRRGTEIPHLSGD